jgi:hypothetical protein
MGLRYRFELVTHTAAIDALLGTVAEHLTEPDASRLRAALPWVPEIDRDLVWGAGRPERDRQGILCLASEGEPRPNDFCLSFAFRPDAELDAYARALGAAQTGTRVAVGCVWTQLHVGDEHALLSATAATSDMSRLFASSRSVHDTWIEIARASRALAVFLDTERDFDRDCLWPEAKAVPLVGPDGFWSGDFESLRVDAYCFELLRSARIE